MINAYARLVGLNPSEITRMYLDAAYAFQVGKARNDTLPEVGGSSRRARSTRSRQQGGEFDERPPRQNAFGRTLYDDRRTFARSDYDVPSSSSRLRQAERTHPSRHAAVPGSQYTNFYAGPQGTGTMQSRLPFVIAGVIILVLLIVILWQAIHTLRRKREIERLKDSYLEINRQLTDINHRLNATNSALVRTNDQLNDANRIKSEYVSQYMQLCSSYIQRLDTYRMGIIKLLKTESAEQTLITLRSQELIQTEHRNFLRLFDETFLGLFPDFIEQVCGLLHDPERFMPKRRRQLSTELRYLALIRLGVSDSAQIAMFLNSTLSTIYTYRARLRNARIDKTSDIEEQIQRIGIS